MYKIYNNIEDKDIFQGNERELLEFVVKILEENGDENFSILGISDATEYIEDYCENLELI